MERLVTHPVEELGRPQGTRPDGRNAVKHRLGLSRVPPMAGSWARHEPEGALIRLDQAAELVVSRRSELDPGLRRVQELASGVDEDVPHPRAAGGLARSHSRVEKAVELVPAADSADVLLKHERNH